MRPLPTLAVSLVSILALAACSGAASTPSPLPEPSGDPGADLDGRTFLSTDISGRTLVAGSRVRMTFQAGSLSANAGCNAMSGGYEVVDGRLRTGPMATTEIGCEEPLMA
ncbi:MAG: META domain-containing protein, partial [Chloroflexi bacterium]|nr:META domain-containing protein [Chloroflexota bacterium]